MSEHQSKPLFSSSRFISALGILLAAALAFLIVSFPRAPHPLKGQPAPDLDLPLLDGGRLQLADHRGAEIVILDFWATWCAPCRRSMPALERVAADYADRGVATYAVNGAESPEAIRGFLDEINLDLVTALDTDLAAANAFQADAIPQTVIIDRSGAIHEVIVGAGPRYERTLRRTLDQLLRART